MPRLNDLVDEAALAYGDQIFGLTDPELWEIDYDPDLETLSVYEGFRRSSQAGGRSR